jgi:hypothetical protein
LRIARARQRKEAITLITPERAFRVIAATIKLCNGSARPRPISRRRAQSASGRSWAVRQGGCKEHQAGDRKGCRPWRSRIRPYGADTIFNRQGIDVFIVMLHDQGHIATKL